MFDSIVNHEGDLLIVHFSDSVDRAQSEQCYQLVQKIIPNTKPGFTVITDLGRLAQMEFECSEHVSEIMVLCSKAQVAKVLRVITDPKVDIGWNIMSKFNYDPKEVQIETLPTFYLAMKTYLIERAQALSAKS